MMFQRIHGSKEINKVSNMLNVKSLEVQNMESGLTGGDLHLNQKVDNETENDLMSFWLMTDKIRKNPTKTSMIKHKKRFY